MARLTTYAEERRERERAAARAATKYVYNATALIDMGDPRCMAIDGRLVVKTQPHGCPRNGTMGMCYVACAFTGEFLGMVTMRCLKRATRAEVAAFERAEAA